jgi:hypothetical protein
MAAAIARRAPMASLVLFGFGSCQPLQLILSGLRFVRICGLIDFGSSVSGEAKPAAEKRAMRLEAFRKTCRRGYFVGLIGATEVVPFQNSFVKQSANFYLSG